ncbi:hypothetical protein V6N12_017422 [Hibiscus sabdariffa]|uniref:Protein kinase domain-containing protein n=1 Tax=Hibiscus sabdariffa TaxID=183260 RepID=A0ABR2CFF6_9ROSI
MAAESILLPNINNNAAKTSISSSCSPPPSPVHLYLYYDDGLRYSLGPAHSFMGFLAKLVAYFDKRFKSARSGSAAEGGIDDGSDTDGLFFDLRVLQIATVNFSELNRLGHGGFGPVYKGSMPNGPEKMLVYEYLPNRSLDYFIFDKRKLFPGDDTHLNTFRIAGTPGYMAPEYAMHGYLSVKADVFSYGVVVLEIVSGRKNHDSGLGSEKANLLNYSWLLFRGHKSLDLVDPALEEYNPEEAAKCIQLALLCCQQTVSERPDMNTVHLMLSSDSFTMPRPAKPAIQGHVGRWKTTSAFTNTNASSTSTGVTKASAGSSFVEDYSRNSMSYSSIDEGR